MGKVIIIALNTFRESVRSKVLYSALFFAFILVIASALFGSVTIGDRLKVIKDFGLLSTSFFAVALVVISGASLLYKELNRKTIYNILGKAVHRWQFLLGKELGLLLTTGILISLLSIGLVVFVYCLGGGLDMLLLVAALYILLEMLVVTSVAIFFSSLVVTPLFIGLFTFSVFIAGRSIEYVALLREQMASNWAAENLISVIYWILPHLNQLSISDQAAYGIGVEPEHLLYSCAYAFGYSGIVFVLASLAFRAREFN